MSLRQLPSVDRLAAALPAEGLPRLVVVEVARRSVEKARALIADGTPDVDAEDIAREELSRLARLRPTRVVNATGVLLHTNLGRAPLHPEAAEAARRAAIHYGNLEFDLAKGTRGGRGAYLRRLLADLCAAEAALVVNNNAGALFLTLAALARDRAVPVSRGELIEIGGSYRLPELMAASGARMIEVGTTNRTRAADYEAALDQDPALLLKVHPSNYRVVGFTEEVSLSELAALARQTAAPLVFDAGSGLLDEEVPWLPGPPPQWLQGEPGIRQSLRAGADLVLVSGDKLLGGPQAGLVTGRGDLVERLAGHPIGRAMRADGPTLAALTTTLELYADGRGDEIPFWRMAALTDQELEERLAVVLAESAVKGEIRQGASVPGAGSVPGASVPSPVLVITAKDPDTVWARLLAARPVSVVARREAGHVVIDLRAVVPEDDRSLAEAIRFACPS